MALAIHEERTLRMLKTGGVDVYDISEKLHNLVNKPRDIKYDQIKHGRDAANIAKKLNKDVEKILRKYLNPLREMGYIDCPSGSMFYITEKGIDYIDCLDKDKNPLLFYLRKYIIKPLRRIFT